MVKYWTCSGWGMEKFKIIPKGIVKKVSRKQKLTLKEFSIEGKVKRYNSFFNLNYRKSW